MENQSFDNISLVPNFLSKIIEGKDLTFDNNPIEQELTNNYSKKITDKEKIKNFELISKQLILLGFKPREVLNSFLVYQYTTVEEGVELLSEKNSLKNHYFIESDESKCYICSEPQERHIQKQVNILVPNLITREEIIQKQSNVSNNTSLILSSNECQICFGEITENNSFCLKCQHKFCKDCIIEYLTEEIKNSRVLDIKCPYGKCKEIFTEEILSELLSPEIMKKYRKFLEREKIRRCPDLVLCPFVDCEGFAEKPMKDSGVMKENESIPEQHDKSLLIPEENPKVKLVCNHGHQFCSLCNQQWHGDSSCSEDKDIKDFATNSGFIVKKCPKCKAWIEKNKGCNHMTCKICQFSWCWRCEKECLPDHYDIVGSPCYGKLYDDDSGVLLRYTLMLMRIPFEFRAIFVPLFSFLFFLENAIHSALFDELPEERNNLEAQNNREPLINGRQRRRRSSKAGLIISLSCFMICLFSTFIIINGYLSMSFSYSFGTKKFKKFQKFIDYFMNKVLLCLVFTYFITGIFINLSWFISMEVFLIYKVCTSEVAE